MRTRGRGTHYIQSLTLETKAASFYCSMYLTHRLQDYRNVPHYLPSGPTQVPPTSLCFPFLFQLTLLYFFSKLLCIYKIHNLENISTTVNCMINKNITAEYTKKNQYLILTILCTVHNNAYFQIVLKYINWSLFKLVTHIYTFFFPFLSSLS